MKYQLEIEIQKPRDAVLELFDDPSNMKKWQPSLLEYRHLSGEQGQPGAKSEQVHKLGKRDVTMIETITKRKSAGRIVSHVRGQELFQLRPQYV